MRQLLFIPFLLIAAFLSAQTKSPASYNQAQAAPPPQKLAPRDCYVRKFDAGTSAMRRGDNLAALRLFEEAKLCPEAFGNSRRLKELDDRIELCESRMGKKKQAGQLSGATAERRSEDLELTGRKFRVSSAFARNTDANCFQLTVREADRAFRDSCWRDAANLYRAAKSCADANQTDRERMNARIEVCTEAEEDELLQKEQKAIRTARHAIAAKFASDAAALLRQGNRSLAWRLADFANFYIATDDNPQCLEVMYDACFFNPDANDKVSFRPPLCYELGENLGDNIQFRFVKGPSSEYLYALLPYEKKTMMWELPSLKLKGISIAENLSGITGFDVSANGSIVYFGANWYYSSNTDQMVPVYRVTLHCFNEEGDVFYYADEESGVIRSLNLNLGSRSQVQRKNANVFNYNRVIFNNIPFNANLQAIKAYRDELWFAYNDRVEVITRNKTGTGIAVKTTWELSDSLMQQETILKMYLFPNTRELEVVTDAGSHYFFLNYAPDGSTRISVTPVTYHNRQVQNCVQIGDTLLALSTAFINETQEEVVTLFTPADNRIINNFYSNSGLAGSYSLEISPSGRWVVCQDGNRATKIWALRDSSVNQPYGIEIGSENRLSPDGNHFFLKSGDKLKIYDIDDMVGGEHQDFACSADISFLPEGLSDKWAVYINSAGDMALDHLTEKRSFHFKPGIVNNGKIPFAFDDTESQYFAYASGAGVVKVKSLHDGAELASYNFGGNVHLIRSIPWTDKLLVVTSVSYPTTSRYTVKLWDINRPQSVPEAIRLQDYSVFMARVSEQGDRIALSNGTDIRIFQLDNLNDESTIILPQKTAYINDFAFKPDGLSLAYGDSFGNIAMVDLATGKRLFQFSNIWEGALYPVEKLAFAYQGNRLRLCASGGLFTTDLDINSMRERLQSGARWLIPFTLEQISEYNLEIAFRFPGNFDRLAESGDLPLIGSFFQYFRDQSMGSNNIEQVRTYCDRAITLYELLDENGREGLEVTMHEMYENYILKLLLRNRIDEAAKVVMLLERRFNRPDAAIISSAHNSLLQHDLPAASRLYTDYLLRLSNNEVNFTTKMEDLNNKLSQFQDYGLLDSSQVDCLCQVFQPLDGFDKLCPPGRQFAHSPYTRQLSVYLRVFHLIDSITNSYELDNRTKAKALEHAYQLAKTVEYPNPAIGNHPLESAALALSESYVNLANAEFNSPRTRQYLDKAIGLLMGWQHVGPDTARLIRLAGMRNLMGDYFYQSGNLPDAIKQFQSGLESASKMYSLAGSTSIGQMKPLNDLTGRLYLGLCKARILEGKPAEIRKALKDAEEYSDVKELSIVEGYADLLEHHEESALINFGNISSELQMGECLHMIHRMMEAFPDMRVHLQTFESRFREAWQNIHSNIPPPVVDYWMADYRRQYFVTRQQWDSVLVWINIGLNQAAKLKEQNDEWRYKWLDQHINLIYYNLFVSYSDTAALGRLIRQSEDMLAYIAAKEPGYYSVNYFESNLAHALWLRNGAGDRQRAIAAYQTFLSDPGIDDSFGLLLKDFTDLHRAGVQWTDLSSLINQLKPQGVDLDPSEWKEMSE